jgi:hypothetical protein
MYAAAATELPRNAANGLTKNCRLEASTCWQSVPRKPYGGALFALRLQLKNFIDSDFSIQVNQGETSLEPSCLQSPLSMRLTLGGRCWQAGMRPVND